LIKKLKRERGLITEQSSRLQCHAARVNVLDQLPEDIGLELLDDQRVVLVRLRLRYKMCENYVSSV